MGGYQMYELLVLLGNALFFGFVGYAGGRESCRKNICRPLELENSFLNGRIVDEKEKLMNLLSQCNTSLAEFELANGSLAYMKRKKRIIDWFLKYIYNQDRKKSSEMSDEKLPFDDPDEARSKYSKLKKELLNPRIFELYKQVFSSEEENSESTDDSDRLHLRYVTAVRDIALTELDHRKALFERMKALAQLDMDDENEYKNIKEYETIWQETARENKEMDCLVREVEEQLRKLEEQNGKQ
jgi:hypothetical protein